MTPTGLSAPTPSWADSLGARYLWNPAPPDSQALTRMPYKPGLLFLIHLAWGGHKPFAQQACFEHFLPLWWDAMAPGPPGGMEDTNGNGLPEGSSADPFLPEGGDPGADRVGLSALWLLDGETLLQWGSDTVDAPRQKALTGHLQDTAEALNSTLWQASAGGYRDRRTDGTWCQEETLFNFLPLATMGPSPTQRQMLLERLLEPGAFRQTSGFCLEPGSIHPLTNLIDPWPNLIILQGLLRSGATAQAHALSRDLAHAIRAVWNSHHRSCARFLLSGEPSGLAHQARSLLLTSPLFAPASGLPLLTPFRICPLPPPSGPSRQPWPLPFD